MDSWSSKLIGCRRLLEMGLSKTQGSMDAGQKCVLMQFNWMASMGKTMLLGVRPLDTLREIKCINRSELLPEETEMALQQQHWWANMPDFRMHLLLREATDLAAETHRLREEGGPRAVERLLRMMPRVAELVAKVESWHPDLSAVGPEYAASVQHFNQLWRQGLLCYVYHDVYLLDSTDERIQCCVEASMGALRGLTWLQACLWPLFMLAVHARTATSRDCFETGLIDMHATLGFMAPKSLVLVLRRIWDRADSGSSETWKQMVEDMGVELNILL